MAGAFKRLQGDWDDYAAQRGALVQSATGPSGETAIAELDRFMLNRLLFEAAGCLDSIAYSQSERLKIAVEAQRRAATARRSAERSQG